MDKIIINIGITLVLFFIVLLALFAGLLVTAFSVLERRCAVFILGSTIQPEGEG